MYMTHYLYTTHNYSLPVILIFMDDIDNKTEFLKKRSLTRTDDLRQTLDQLESAISQLSYSTRDEALQIPVLMDEATDIIAILTTQGANPREEITRFESIQAQLHSRGGLFLRQIGGASNLRAAREDRQPDPDRWWWYIDQMEQDKKNHQIKRIVGISFVIIILLGILLLLYNQFLAPDEATRASYNHQLRGERLAAEGDYATALEEINQALTYTPEDGSLLIIKGILEEQLGQAGMAEKSFTAAQTAFENLEDFLLTKATTHLQLGQIEQVMTETDAALALNPDSTLAYLFKAQAYEILGDFQQANENYEIANDLAIKNDETELQALIRMNMGQMQRKILMPTLSPPDP